jgi:hypothetical protein
MEPLYFAPGLTHLSVPPCKDLNTLARIQESDALVMCRLNINITLYIFKNMQL